MSKFCSAMEATWDDLGFGTYAVTVIPHYVHQLSDGVEIAMKLWLPWKTKTDSIEKICGDDLLYDGIQRFPAILEYLPYRKSDWTASRDHSRHSWFCSHGYVCVRADMRGSGDSSGYYFDEYEEQEQNDCIEIINWLSSAPWSNGRVGMYGKSWGGFNGLQVAYRKPKGLATVISLYSTDNRFTDDVHYIGNCLMGTGMLSWSSTMLLWNARPVTPKYCQSFAEFKQRWKDRSEKTTKCWAKTWMEHQTYDDYWKHGSICENYANVSCPVLIIGGLTDSYMNAAFRMAALLNYQSRAIIGPWTHDWPDVSAAGPTIDYLTVCLNWWDFYLKGKEIAAQDVSRWPTLQVYVRQPFPPSPTHDQFEGTWFDVPKWSDIFKSYSNGEQTECTKTFHLRAEHLLLETPTAETALITLPRPHLLQGLFCGDWVTWDSAWRPSTQTISNKFSVCWTSPQLNKALTICGFTKVNVEIHATAAGKYALAARLCHLWPDGESTLITYGICNLNYTNKVEEPEMQNQFVFELNATTYTIPKGHRICLALAPSLFPLLYPMPCNKCDLILHQENCNIVIQVLPEEFCKECNRFAPSRPLLLFPTKEIDKPANSVKVEYELNSDLVKFTKFSNKGRKFYPMLDLEYDEQCVEVYETNFDVDFCKISISNSMEMKFKSDDPDKCIDTKVETTSVLTADESEFHLCNEVKTFLDGEKFFALSWSDDIPRTYV